MAIYSTKDLSDKAIAEIKQALSDLEFGSVEIFVQNGEITQITKKTIKKTTHKETSDNNRVNFKKGVLTKTL